jgi:hypothetical protein
MGNQSSRQGNAWRGDGGAPGNAETEPEPTSQASEEGNGMVNYYV